MQIRVGGRHVLVLEVVTPVGSGTAKVEVLVSSRRRTVPTVKVGVFTFLGWLQKLDAMVAITKHMGSRDVILDEVRDARRERSRVRRKGVSCSRGTTRRTGRVRCNTTKRATTTGIGRLNTSRAASRRRRRWSWRGRQSAPARMRDSVPRRPEKTREQSQSHTHLADEGPPKSAITCASSAP